MARLSRLQLPVFSVSEWSVDQHSPADPEAAASNQRRKTKRLGGGEEVDRIGLEGGGGGGGGGACPRAQPTKPQLSMLACCWTGHDIIG